MSDEGKERIELIRKEVEEKLKNYHLSSDYKEQLDYLFDQLKDHDFCQEMPLIDVAGDKEKGIVYINLYRTDYSKDMSEELTCPNCPIERDPYYLTDDIDNYIVKEDATDDVVAIIKKSKLRDWEAFHAASDVVKYLNLSEEEKNKPLKDW